jgi:hypothetical protein
MIRFLWDFSPSRPISSADDVVKLIFFAAGAACYTDLIILCCRKRTANLLLTLPKNHIDVLSAHFAEHLHPAFDTFVMSPFDVYFGATEYCDFTPPCYLCHSRFQTQV